MKAHVIGNKTVIPWPYGDAPLPEGSEGYLIPVVYDLVPALTATQMVVPGPIVTDVDGSGNPTQQRQTWMVREIDPASLARTAQISDMIAKGEAALASWPPSAANQLQLLRGLTHVVVQLLKERRIDLSLPQ